MNKTDFLTFTISKKKARYDKNQIIYNVSLKINEFRKYYNNIKDKIALIEEQDIRCQKIASLLKGNVKNFNQEKVNNTILELNQSLEIIRKIANESILIEDKYSSFEYEWVEFNQWLQGKKDFNGLYDKIDHLLSTLHNNINRTIRMFEVLKELEHKYLQVLITFNKNDIDIHFIKYALNEESFAESIKLILEDEFNDKFMEEYRIMENTFFHMYDSLWHGNVENFLEKSYALFIIDQKMKDFDQLFLNEQDRSDEINSMKNRLVTYLEKVDDLFFNIHKSLKKRFPNNYNDLFVKTLYVINEMDINLFKSIEIDKIEKTIDFLENKILNIKKYPKIITLDTLNLIDEKSLYLKRRHIYKIKSEDHSLIDFNKGFMLRKAEKGIFDRRFYSHIVSLFKFLNNDYKKNRYTNVKGFDKVFDKKYLIPIQGNYKINKRQIRYISLIEIRDYYINLNEAK